MCKTVSSGISSNRAAKTWTKVSKTGSDAARASSATARGVATDLAGPEGES